MSARAPARLCLALLSVMALAVPFGQLTAQGPTGTIEGTVTDAGSKRPVANAQVSIIGTGGTVGALTNATGQFRILNVAPGPRRVRARLLGYAPQEKTVQVTANGTATVELALTQSAVELNAIVTTGTGGSQVEARKLGNTVATVEAPPNVPLANFSAMLQGREAGVVMLPSSGLTGEGSRIRIRGSASLSQSNEPIVYIDGVRIDNGGGFGSSGQVGTGGGGTPSRLDDIDPSSIEKVEVLKGAAAATLYGTEASNGVLLITTKKGVASAPRWTFEVEQGVKSYPADRIEDQWGVAANSLTATGARRCSVTDTACHAAQAARLAQHYGFTIQPYEPFSRDFATQLFETGRSTVVGAQVTGGTPLITYFGSLRGSMEDGPFSADKFDWEDVRGKQGVLSKDINNRYTATTTLGLTPTRTFKLSSTMLYSNNRLEIPQNNNSIYAPYTVALFSKPENAQCEASVADGLNVATNGSAGNGYCAGPGNPMGASTFASNRELVQETIKQDARHFNGNVRASYVPTQNFNLDATFGVDFTAQRSAQFLPFGNNVDRRINRANAGQAALDDRFHQELTLSVNGGYTRDLLANFSSNFIFGAQGFVTRDNNEGSFNRNFPGPGIEVVGGGDAPGVSEVFSSIVNAGYFGQEQMGWNDWVFVTAGGRYDYNSAFGRTSGGVFYPQASVSVIPSDHAGWRDNFMSKYLSSFRLRAAFGRAGRQPGAFDKLTTFRPLTGPTGSGLVPGNLGNRDLRPEVSTEVEMGAELGIREDQTSFAFTRWQRSTKDALYAKRYPVTGGFRALQLSNIGELTAWGWDARVKSFVVNRPGLSADVYGNIGFLSQLVKSLGGASEIKVGGSYPRYRNFVKEGYAPSSFFSARVPLPCPAGANQYLPKQPTTPAAKTTGGVCLMPNQLPVDVAGGTSGTLPLGGPDGIPDTEAQLLAYLASPRLLTSVSPMLADDDNDGDRLDHYDGKPFPDFEGSFGGTVTIKENWRVGTNLEYRFGNYTVSDLTGAFRRSSPANGGNTKARAVAEGILMNPASTPEQRLAAAKTNWYELYGLSPADGMNQQYAADFLRWRELSLTYIAPQRIAAKAGANEMQVTFAARNFMLWTKYPGVDPEVNLIGRRTGGGTDNNFAEGIDAFGFPIPRMFSLTFRLGY